MRRYRQYFAEFLRRTDRRVSGFKVLIALELLLIAVCFFQYFIPLHQYTFQGQDLTASICRYQAYSDDFDTGCYLDESLIPDDVDAGLLYIGTPRVDLPKGSYRVSIVYSTDDPNQKYAFTSKYREYSVVTGHNGNRIPMNANRVEHSFFSLMQVKEFETHVNYSGSGYLFVESVEISETNAWKNVLLFFVLLFSLLLDGIILGYRRLPENSRRRARIIWVGLIGLAVFTSVPLMSIFILDGDDLMFHLNRIEAIKTSFLEGQFPNRVSSFWNEGYGYASAIFYGEAFLYVPALLRILGFSVQGAYKFYVVLVNLATAAVSYYSFRKVFHNDQAALFGSAVYMMAPYRLVNIYMRAAVGEYTAMLFFPLIFCGLMQIYSEDTQDADYKNSYLPLILGFTGIIQCHVISCVIAGAFTGLFCLVFIKKTLCPARLIQMAKAAVWTFLLNIWFLLPFADYMHLGYANNSAVSAALGRANSHGAFLNQMLTLFQEANAPAYTTVEGMGEIHERNYALGGFVLVAVLYLFYRLYQGRMQSKIAKIGDYSLAFGTIAVLICTIWFPWNYFQNMNRLTRMITTNIQFPWRFLGVACFFLTVTTVCLVCLLQDCKDRYLYRLILVLLGAFFILSADYYMYGYGQKASNHLYEDEAKLDSAYVGQAEYIPEDTPENFTDDTALAPGAGLELIGERRVKGVHIVECRNTTAEDTCIDLPILPYRGYVCRDQETGDELAVELWSVSGRLRVVVPGGYKGTFRVWYEEPWYWRAAELISVLALFGGAAVFAREKIKHRRYSAKATV